MEANPTTERPEYQNKVDAIRAVFSVPHFIFQTLADVTVHAESKLVEKVSNKEISYQDNYTYRKLRTVQLQEQGLKKYNDISAQLKAGVRPKATDKLQTA